MDSVQLIGGRKFIRQNNKYSIIQKNNNKKNIEPKQKENKVRKIFSFKRLIIVFILLLILFIIIFVAIIIVKPSKPRRRKRKKSKVLFDLGFKPKKLKMIKYDEEINNKNLSCDLIDPIYLFQERINKGPIVVCSGEESKHICYQNPHNHNNDIYYYKNGVICIMENIVLDPSYSRQSGLSFADGPVDSSNHGAPLLSKGFFNVECKVNKSIIFNYNYIYSTYFNAWNYEYNIEKEEEKLEELAPGKVVFFISRNQDSPNLFHGGSEIFNVLSMISLFNLDPKDIQVVFLESIEIPYYEEETPNNKDIPRDPFYILYKKMLSRGGEPIYIKNLKKKYKISKAIHVPINWDSPLFIGHSIPECKTPTKAYKLYNDFVDKYLDIKPFKDTFVTDNETFYYPESVLKSHESNIKFDIIVTIQWRRVWPKKRKGQFRIINNGPQLADKLASKLPKNILIRLINNARLKFEDQIALMRSTDYLIGIHGAGLSLSIYLPPNSILNEIQFEKKLRKRSVLGLMSALSGHRTFVDYVNSEVSKIEGNQMISFNEEEFAKVVFEHMKENNFF